MWSLEILSRFNDELSTSNNDVDNQHRLMSKCIQRVSVQGGRVVEITVYDGLRVIIGEKVAIQAKTMDESQLAASV